MCKGQDHTHDETDYLKNAILGVITGPEGLGVQFEDQVGIERIDKNGEFAVWWEDVDDVRQELYHFASEAVDRFLEVRKQHKLGLDFEEPNAAEDVIVCDQRVS
jgi:hypothetical protein